MTLIEDHELLDRDVLERYKKIAKSPLSKALVAIKLKVSKILQYFTLLPRILQLLTYYKITCGHTVLKDIRYSNVAPRNTCDIYPLRNDSKAPVLVFFHGGSWVRGDKNIYPLIGKAMREQGIVSVICNYTLHPGGNVDDMVRDVSNAMVYVKENIAQFGGDPDNITLMGHSAGAHITALYLTTRLVPGEPFPIQNYIGLAGPYDINDHFLHEAYRGNQYFPNLSLS
eukprot:gene5631-6500_t